MGRKVLSIIGALGYDLIMRTNRVPDPGESLISLDYNEALGGKGANAAVAAYRGSRRKPVIPEASLSKDVLDGTEQVTPSDNETTPKGAEEDEIHVTMVGAVGNDDHGKIMKDSLTKNGVDTEGVLVFDGPSPCCFIMVESFSGENRCLFYEGVIRSWQRTHFLKVDDLAHGLTPDLILLQMEIRKEVVEQIIETAGEAGIDILLNAAPADPITKRTYSYLTHLVVNETEAAILSGRELDEVTRESWPTICKEFLQRGAKNVVITVGEQGAFFATETDSGLVPAYKVSVVDTTGAGDTWTGNYSTEYLRQKAAGTWDIRKAIERANKACAFTIGKLGCQDGIPWADEIDGLEAEINVIHSAQGSIIEGTLEDR